MINGSTRIFGILGQPVSHSLSPAMHNAAFQAQGVNAVYVAFPVQNLEQAVLGLRGLNIGGVSVTIPFKEAIIPLLDEIEAQAAAMGAVNTVVNHEGRLKGSNTDYLGAIAALRDHTQINGQHFLVLGAGGAARAIAFGIQEAGGRVSVSDIDWDRAQALAQEFKLEAIPLTALAQCPATNLINATPIGMTPKVEEIPIDANLLGRMALVMDIVYQPLQTRLLRESAARGGKTIDGLQMLVYQGAAQFELFTGQPAPVEVMRQAALAGLALTSK
ncbi:MAG: shikimate dehydrogenase [Desulfobacca sp. 4484_104]|nr:MAG: shikimate dehydrogenase [Desulfobacca sp. 4484_104]RLA90418.1 MAG: shikimate dehydrogenase [Deltaproteobacteria bacterium]